MKKLLLTLALVSALTVTGCSNNSDKPADNNTKTEQNAEKPAEKTEEKTEEKAAIKEMKGADLEAIEQDKKKKKLYWLLTLEAKKNTTKVTLNGLSICQLTLSNKKFLS